MFHDCWAAFLTLSKFQPGFSACQFWFAFAVLTYEMPTLACTVAFAVVSKVTETARGLLPEPATTVDAVNGRSKTMS